MVEEESMRKISSPTQASDKRYLEINMLAVADEKSPRGMLNPTSAIDL